MLTIRIDYCRGRACGREFHRSNEWFPGLCYPTDEMPAHRSYSLSAQSRQEICRKFHRLEIIERRPNAGTTVLRLSSDNPARQFRRNYPPPVRSCRGGTRGNLNETVFGESVALLQTCQSPSKSRSISFEFERKSKLSLINDESALCAHAARNSATNMRDTCASSS